MRWIDIADLLVIPEAATGVPADELKHDKGNRKPAKPR